MDKKTLPFATIVVACRNEEKHIGKCLEALLEQDYPKEKLEIVVVDGASGDKTREIVKQIQAARGGIKLLDNPHKFTPFAFNIGIRAAAGEIIAIMGAHSDYSRNYLSACVTSLIEYGADAAGGHMIAKPRENNILGRAIVLALAHPFGAGNAHFRLGTDKPKWVDTIFGGCYKKEIFEKAGYYNEKLTRGQDMEFNIRLKKIGGKILLIPGAECSYYARSSLKEFFVHDFAGGSWVIYSRKFTRESLRLRHYLPALCFSAAIILAAAGFYLPVFWIILAGFAGLYALLSLYFSVKIAVKERDWRYAFLMPITFGSRHLAYALGSLNGFSKLIFYK